MIIVGNWVWGLKIGDQGLGNGDQRSAIWFGNWNWCLRFEIRDWNRIWELRLGIRIKLGDWH